MRLLVTGTQGQVAQSLVQKGSRTLDIKVIALGRPQLDLANPDTILPALAASKPDIIVNAAAYTAVDQAENEPDTAFAINRDGAGAVAAAAGALGVPLIHLSTDYVYSGDKTTPYAEDDKTGPLGVYGKSKLEGEWAVRRALPGAIILRTSWVYSPFGKNFVKTILRLGRERPLLKVVADQFGNPTSALDIAEAISRIAPSADQSGGIYHLAGTGHCSWYDFAKEIIASPWGCAGKSEVQAISTAEYPTLAKRPANSVLDTSAFCKQFGFTLPDWKASLEETLKQLSVQ